MTSQGIALFEAFYRSGVLVFGGGHVVLPLLSEAALERSFHLKLKIRRCPHADSPPTGDRLQALRS
jgi:hypothetical protein